MSANDKKRRVVDLMTPRVEETAESIDLIIAHAHDESLEPRNRLQGVIARLHQLKNAAPQASGSPEHSMDSANPAAAAPCSDKNGELPRTERIRELFKSGHTSTMMTEVEQLESELATAMQSNAALESNIRARTPPSATEPTEAMLQAALDADVGTLDTPLRELYRLIYMAMAAKATPSATRRDIHAEAMYDLARWCGWNSFSSTSPVSWIMEKMTPENRSLYVLEPSTKEKP